MNQERTFSEDKDFAAGSLEESLQSGSAEWYATDVLQLVNVLKTNLNTGLTRSEAEIRLRQFANRAGDLYREQPLLSLLGELIQNPATLLAYGYGIALLVGAWLGASLSVFSSLFVLALTSGSLVLRLLQHRITGRHLRSVEHRTRRRTRVLRDGHLREADPEDLVPGDVLWLRAGDYVPADARIVQAKELLVNESALTGISDLIVKTEETLEGPRPLSEQSNMLFAGSYIAAGFAKAVVVATGDRREIAFLHARRTLRLPVPSIVSHLQKYQTRFAWVGAVGGVALALLVSALGGFAFGPTVGGVGAGVAFCFALLPAFLELTGAIPFVQGLRQLESHGTIVQRPESLEALSATTALCFDPRGVLTRREMAVHHLLLDAQVLEADRLVALFREGEGEERDAEERAVGETDETEILPGVRGLRVPGESVPSDLYLLLLSALLAAEENEPGEEGFEALEPEALRALRRLAEQVGVDVSDYRTHLTKVAAFPYDPQRGCQSVLFETSEERGTLFVIGRPESVVERCRLIRLYGEEDVLQARQKDRMVQLSQLLRQSANEVVAVAYRKFRGDPMDWGLAEEVETELTLIGLFSLRDAPHSDLRQTLEACWRSGLRLIILSDYEPEVVARIARECGLLEHRSQLITDEEMRRKDDAELLSLLDRITVYARLQADQKARVISLLERQGHRVAFVGRRLYDIPALHAASVALVPIEGSTDATAHEADVLVGEVSLRSLYRLLLFAKEAGRGVRRLVQWVVGWHLSAAIAVGLGWTLGAMGLMSTPRWQLSDLLWLEIGTVAIPLAFAASRLTILPSSRWYVANRNVRSQVHWVEVARDGVFLGLLALGVGGVLKAYLPVHEAIERSGVVGAAFAWTLAAGLLLIKELKPVDGSAIGYLVGNGRFALGLLLGLLWVGLLFGVPLGDAWRFGAPEWVPSRLWAVMAVGLTGLLLPVRERS